jgi:hypothetical protein
VAYSTGRELSDTSVLVPLGTPRDSLLDQLGPPDAWLSPDVWIYWNRCTNQPHVTRDCDTLLVMFRKEYVQAFKIVPGAPVRRFLAAQEKRNPAASLMASYLPTGRANK